MKKLIMALMLCLVSVCGFGQTYTNYTTINGQTYKTTVIINGNNSYANTTTVDTHTRPRECHYYSSISVNKNYLEIYEEPLAMDTVYGPVCLDKGIYPFNLVFSKTSEPGRISADGYWNTYNRINPISDIWYVDGILIKQEYYGSEFFKNFMKKLQPNSTITIVWRKDSSITKSITLNQEQYDAIMQFYGIN